MNYRAMPTTVMQPRRRSWWHRHAWSVKCSVSGLVVVTGVGSVLAAHRFVDAEDSVKALTEVKPVLSIAEIPVAATESDGAEGAAKPEKGSVLAVRGSCLKVAQHLLNLKDLPRLLVYSRCARQQNPSAPLPYLYESVALQLLGRRSEAAEMYARFASMSPRHGRAREALLVSRQLREVSEGRDE